jgi:hypothetical protein
MILKKTCEEMKAVFIRMKWNINKNLDDIGRVWKMFEMNIYKPYPADGKVLETQTILRNS